MKRLRWLNTHPVAIINILFIFLLTSLFFYQLLRPLDVLEGWTIELSNPTEHKVLDGKRYAIYHPGDMLTFESKSNKLVDAQGTTTRTLLCQATDQQAEREIQLDVIPASRPVGIAPTRESAITMPDVAQYDGLPRICRLIIDIVYPKLALARNHSEHAETEPFLVEEVRLTPREAKAMIEELTRRIEELEALQGESFTTQASNQAQTPQANRPQIPAGQTPLEDIPEYSEPRKSPVETVVDGANGLINGLLSLPNQIKGIL